jgi:hypothetical protein
METTMTFSWAETASAIHEVVANGHLPLDDGQRASLSWIADRLAGEISARVTGDDRQKLRAAIDQLTVCAGRMPVGRLPTRCISMTNSWGLRSAKFFACRKRACSSAG